MSITGDMGVAGGAGGCPECRCGLRCGRQAQAPCTGGRPATRRQALFIPTPCIGVLSSPPSFVCPTEIIAFSDRAKEFEAANCQVGGRTGGRGTSSDSSSDSYGLRPCGLLRGSLLLA